MPEPWITPPLAHVCPACRANYHAGCDGIAWDDERDETTQCECESAGHPEEEA